MSDGLWSAGLDGDSSGDSGDEFYDQPHDESGIDSGQLVYTGQPAVDAAMLALAQVGGAGLDEQVAAFQAADRTLRETLASIDDA